MNHFVPQFVGHAAYECGNCHRVQTFPVSAISTTQIPTQMCWCAGPLNPHQMYPINDLAKSNDAFRESLYQQQAGKERARKFMQEVNW